MLRIIVISLVVANVLLIGFQTSKPPVKEKVANVPIEEQSTGIPTIHLFSELMEDQGLMTGNRQCFTLGPFHSSEDMYDTYRRLQEVSVGIQDRETQALVEKGYWVFLPPYATLLEANEVLLSLQALGLKDIGVIYDGQHERSISLGYFLRQENALKRMKGLESRGYRPLIRVQRQAEPRYWLDYEQNPGSALIALDMQSRPNDFMQRALPCPEKALLEANVTEPPLSIENEVTQDVDSPREDDGSDSEKG